MGELLTISWPAHYQHLSEGIWNLFEQDLETDFEITACKSEEGSERCKVKAHYLILSAFCVALKKSAERRFHFVSELDVGEEDLRCLVEFVYRGKIQVNEDRLLVLRNAADKVGLTTLVEQIDRKSKSRREIRQRKVGKRFAKFNESCSSKRKKKSPVKIPQNSITTRHYCLRKPQQNKQLKHYASNESETEDDDQELIEKSEKLKSYKSMARKRLKLENAKKCQLKKSKECSESSDVELICYLCDRKFKNSLNFQHHMRCHKEPEILLKCSHCSLKVETSEQLKKHMASKHQLDIDGKALEKTIRCPDCEFSCVAKFQLKNHQTFKHGARMHACDQCPYTCHSRSALRKHMNGVHCDTRPFMCETCGFCSKTLGGLTRHTLIHQDKVVCDICGINLSTKALSRHVTMLHGDGKHRKQFPCHMCSFATRDRFNLKVHLRNVHKLLEEDVTAVLNKAANNSLQSSGEMEEETSHLDSEPNADHNLLLYQLETIL